MCPACIGATALLLTGAGSAGGLAVLGSLVVRRRSAALRVQDTRNRPALDEELQKSTASTSNRRSRK